MTESGREAAGEFVGFNSQILRLKIIYAAKPAKVLTNTQRYIPISATGGLFLVCIKPIFLIPLGFQLLLNTLIYTEIPLWNIDLSVVPSAVLRARLRIVVIVNTGSAATTATASATTAWYEYTF